MKIVVFYFCLILSINTLYSQSITEFATMKNLSIPSSSRQNYLGKASIATFDSDISLAMSNPSLVNYEMRRKLMASTAFYFSSIYSNLSYAMNNDKLGIPIVISGNVLAYGTQNKVDIDGNYYGKFSPIDAAVTLSASKRMENYIFGLSSKLSYGNYFLTSTMGMAFDVSVLHNDPDRDLNVAFLMKNIGYQFVGTNSSTHVAPFDMQLALSKKLKYIPFRYTIMLQELYHWTASTRSEDYGIWPLNPYYETKRTFMGSLMSHFVFGGEFYLGKFLKIGANYDVKKSQEASFDAFRGMTGFSLGFGIYTNKFDFGYSFSKISPISASHQFTFIINTNEWVLFKK